MLKPFDSKALFKKEHKRATRNSDLFCLETNERNQISLGRSGVFRSDRSARFTYMIEIFLFDYYTYHITGKE